VLSQLIARREAPFALAVLAMAIGSSPLVLADVPVPLAAAAAIALGLLAWWAVIDARAVRRTRERIASHVDTMVFADVRERAALASADAERARLARDLHDVPLQSLAGVIRRLDRHAGATDVADALRDVADALRQVVHELRPATLDEFGLATALAVRGRRLEAEHEGRMAVVVDLVDLTGHDVDERPPASVELQLLRIAEEALGNAIRHSHGSRALVTGVVHPTGVRLRIDDDGIGIDGQIVRAATRDGHVGLGCMRQRAQVIGAELSVGPSPTGGTRVDASWTRR
jgi:signal transduction histidine kinase